MVIRERGIVMSAAVYVDRAAKRGLRLRDLLAGRFGVPARDAASLAARRVRIGAGTFENICRGRLKGIEAHINDKLREALARELCSEIERHADELAQLLADGAGADSREVQEISQMVTRLRAAFGSEA
ncbi:hypothetical protein [Xanthobacter autotrophicus]|uniref:hypothetical protein n=1 Tax=Xanthobacter autotrophicus TaxID=280 RepID=UPI003726D68B